MRSGSTGTPSTFRGYVRGAAFGAYATGTLAAWELHARRIPPPERELAVEGYKRHLARRALQLMGLQWEVRGELAPPRRARLVVSNHRTALDIGVVLAAFGGSLLSRGDLAGWPLVGRMARHGGTIFVERGAASSGAVAIRAIRRELAAGGTVVVFPEGTTYDGDEVRPFQGGAFAAARGLDVEVVPVGLAYSGDLTWLPGTSFGAHVLELASAGAKRMVGHVGDPIPWEGSRTAMAEASREAVQALVHRSRDRLEREHGVGGEHGAGGEPRAAREPRTGPSVGNQ